MPQLAVGLPANVVRQRPDARRVERRLASQVALIGVATSVKDNIHAQEEVTQQALLGYEQSVLVALAEVENAMASYREERGRHASLTQAVGATVEASDLVKRFYTNRLADFQNVLDTERFLTTQQDQLASSDGQVLVDLVALYKALRGGWSPKEAISNGPNTKSSLSYQEK